jgi:hypothetical protein
VNPRLGALDFITACLGLRSKTAIQNTLRSAVTAGSLGWCAVVDIANNHLITPALWVALRERELLEILPSDVREYLRELYRLNTIRNEHLRTQVIEAIQRLNSVGVEPILLKGGASLFSNIFEDPGSRVMADLDILVPLRAAENCWNALLALGYSPIVNDFDYSDHHHLRPLYRPGEYGTIEIHRDALPASAARILPTALIWEQSEPVVNECGIALRVPSPTHRVLHNLLHSDLINQTHVRGRISLRSLHELALMQALYRERLDWEAIRRLMEQGGQGRVLRATLYLAHRYFGSSMPDRMRPTPGAVAHYARTRLQVRWHWLDEFVERAFWFSTPSICERYHCDDRFWSVAKGRLRLATQLACKYSSQAFRLIGHQI